MPDRRICDKCGLMPSNHTVGDRRLCCQCYVREGNAPADWHKGCMKEYEKIKQEKDNGKRK